MLATRTKKQARQGRTDGSHLLLPVLIVALLGSLSYQLYDSWNLVNTASPVIQTPIALPAKIDTSIPKPQGNPAFFGEFQSQPVVVEAQAPEQTTIPISSIPLQLDAVYFSNTASVSAVSILFGQEQALYRQSEEVMPGVVIQAIKKDQVLLNRNGQLEVLLLHPDQKLKALPPVIAPRPSQPESSGGSEPASPNNTLQSRLNQMRNRLNKSAG